MFTTIKEFFEVRLTSFGDAAEENKSISIELAAAALMVEISMADSELHRDERQVIEESLRKNFNLEASEINELIETAQHEVDHAVSLYEFTRMLNDTLSYDDKVRILEFLWRVAFADAVLDKYEEYYVRKIADLLYISHKDYIQTKHAAGRE